MISGLTSIRMTILMVAVSVFICLLCIPSKTVMGMLEVISPAGPPERTSFAEREQSAAHDDEVTGTPRSLVTGHDGEFATMLSSLNDVPPKPTVGVQPETAPEHPVVSHPTDPFYQAGPSEPRRGSTSPRHSYV